jgi:hypothetical protein
MNLSAAPRLVVHLIIKPGPSGLPSTRSARLGRRRLQPARPNEVRLPWGAAGAARAG